MNKWISLLLVLCLLLSLSGLSGSAVTARAVVTVCSQGDWLSPTLLEEFSRQTGIEVEYTVSDTLADYGSADLLLADSELLGALEEQGALRALDGLCDGVQEAVDDSFLRERGALDGYAVPVLWTSMGLLYDPTSSDHQVTGWDALFDRRFDGQIVMPERYREAYAAALAALGLDVNAGDDAALRRAEEALERQRPLLLAACSHGALEDYFDAGEAVIAPCYAAIAAGLMAEHPELSFIIPNEGSWRLVISCAVPDSAPRRGYAAELLRYLCSVEHLARIAAYSGYSTTSTDARALLDESWQSNPLAYPELPEGSHLPALAPLGFPQRTRCLEHWARISPAQTAGTNGPEGE